MIVGELAFLARWVQEMKQKQDSENRDYYVGYMSAMSTVEGMIAMMPQYDLDKVKDLPHPGLYTPEEVCEAMRLHAQGDPRFGPWEKIVYSPSEVCGILTKRAEKVL